MPKNQRWGPLGLRNMFLEVEILENQEKGPFGKAKKVQKKENAEKHKGSPSTRQGSVTKIFSPRQASKRLLRERAS